MQVHDFVINILNFQAGLQQKNTFADPHFSDEHCALTETSPSVLIPIILIHCMRASDI